MLLVCRANICRSPMAAVLLQDALRRRNELRAVRIDSAGTHATLPGHPADGRASQICAREHLSLRRSRARQVVEADFTRFAHILAVDAGCLQWLQAASSPVYHSRLTRLGDWAQGGSLGDIPDPYFGSLAGFEEVLTLLRRALDGFVPHLLEEIVRSRREG